MIEGNRLTQEQVAKVIEQQQFAGRERDEKEVLGYYPALEKAKRLRNQALFFLRHTSKVCMAL